MEAKRIEKFKRANLYNMSNVTYKYLKNQMEDSENDRVIINDEFDFDTYKELIRRSLSEFSLSFNSLVAINSNEYRVLASSKAKLKDYVDEILDNPELLERFSIYKLQQFINRVARYSLENNYKNYEEVSNYKETSTKDRFLKYKDIVIDMSEYRGIICDSGIITYLYREFNLKRIKPNEYSEAIKLKEVKESEEYVKELNKFLFKAGAYMDENNHIVKYHPFSDNKNIMDCLRDDCVAERTPKRKKAKEYKLVSEEEISLED